MKKKTGHDKNGEVYLLPSVALKDALETLSDYEETEATPRQIQMMRSIKEKADAHGGIDHLVALDTAAAEEKLFIIPVKVGEYLYAKTRGIISTFQVIGYELTCWDGGLFIKWRVIDGTYGQFSMDGVPAREINESVFVTREGAAG